MESLKNPVGDTSSGVFHILLPKEGLLCILPFECKVERLVEMTAGVVGDGRVGQIHHEGPGGAQESAIPLWLGYGSNGFRELVFIHYTV